MSTADPARRKLDDYAAKVAAELSAARYPLDALTLQREEWQEIRTGLLGLKRTRQQVATTSTQTPGWMLLSDFYEQRDVYETVYSGSRPRRGNQSHELVTRDQVWLSPTGQLLSYFVTHEIVFHGFRHVEYLSPDHHEGPAADWHLRLYDHWRRTHTRRFTPPDRVKETITNSGKPRFSHPYQGVSVALTELRKRAGTYVPPKNRAHGGA